MTGKAISDFIPPVCCKPGQPALCAWKIMHKKYGALCTYSVLDVLYSGLCTYNQCYAFISMHLSLNLRLHVYRQF